MNTDPSWVLSCRRRLACCTSSTRRPISTANGGRGFSGFTADFLRIPALTTAECCGWFESMPQNYSNWIVLDWEAYTFCPKPCLNPHMAVSVPGYTPKKSIVERTKLVNLWLYWLPKAPDKPRTYFKHLPWLWGMWWSLPNLPPVDDETASREPLAHHQDCRSEAAWTMAT